MRAFRFIRFINRGSVYILRFKPEGFVELKFTFLSNSDTFAFQLL